jgi:hypothetical protein
MQRSPEETARMPVVRITGQGLTAIAISVALLWACLLAERWTVHNARQETVRIIRVLDRMRAEKSPSRVVVRPLVRSLGPRAAHL